MTTTLKKSFISLTTLSLVFFLATSASAQDSGKWEFKLATSSSSAQKKIAAGIEDGISDMNFVVRPIARGRLEDTNTVCKTLTFTLADGNISIQCGSGKVFTTPADGSYKKVTGSDNETKYNLSQKVDSKDDKTVITQVFKAEDGKRTTVYTYNHAAKTLTMKVRVNSPKLDPKAVTYTIPYKEQ